jgi:hypothetical protein
MLPFELSVIDLILAIAVIVLLILYLTKSSNNTSTGEKVLVRKESSSEKPATEATTLEEERERPRSTQPQIGSGKCPYGFGYLRKLDREATIPDGCLGCSRLMECYSSDE